MRSRSAVLLYARNEKNFVKCPARSWIDNRRAANFRGAALGGSPAGAVQSSPGNFLVIGLTWKDFTTAPEPLDLAARKADSVKLASAAQQNKGRVFPGLSDAKTFHYDPALLFRQMPTTDLTTDIPDRLLHRCVRLT